MQDPKSSNSLRSDAIYVHYSEPTSVGNLITIKKARVLEFKQNHSSNSLTQLTDVRDFELLKANQLDKIIPRALGLKDQPTELIFENDPYSLSMAVNIESRNEVLNPLRGVDFYESMEYTRVLISDPLVISVYTHNRKILYHMIVIMIFNT